MSYSHLMSHICIDLMSFGYDGVYGASVMDDYKLDCLGAFIFGYLSDL